MADFYALVPISASGCRYLLVCDAVEVGTVILLSRDEKLEIWSLEVYPEYRGLGHSVALLRNAYALALHLKHDRVWLRCNKDNPVALSLYAKEGFKVVNERTHDYEMERMV